MEGEKGASIEEDFIDFLKNSPTAYHAAEEAAKRLRAKGFFELSEKEAWHLRPASRYFVKRRGSSLFAFVTPEKAPLSALVAAAHSDSPALKVKPRGEWQKENMAMIDVEVYGGPLLNSWLNRELGIAGTAVGKMSSGELIERSIILDLAVTIPQLAIHLDKQVNESGLLLNKQSHLSAIAALDSKGGSPLEKALREKLPGCKEILAFDLFLYPLEEPKLLGENRELIACYRYDNLGSAHAALTGLLSECSPESDVLKVVAVWDHEEVGSHSTKGAASPFFKDTFRRIMLQLSEKEEEIYRAINSSICLSIDQAHALHPNYPEKHDSRHAPLLGKGVAIKQNAQQRYATTALGAATVKKLCAENEIPYQEFVSRGDMPCGSTIGPLHATATGMETVDIGTPQLSMHSARELSAVSDHLAMVRLVEAFFRSVTVFPHRASSCGDGAADIGTDHL